MSAPGMAPPGVQQANTQANRPSGLPASFQAPPNLPSNINFNAPVIRLGTGPSKAPLGPTTANRKDSDGPASSSTGRTGHGGERGEREGGSRAREREAAALLVPPTKEEIIRTVFIGNITEGLGGNAGVQKLLSAAGKLRRWDRAAGADGKECTFGFAQFEDAESLAVAVEVLDDIWVPDKVQKAAEKQPDSSTDGDDTDGIEKSKLIFTVDAGTKSYLETYRESRGDEFTQAVDAKVKEARQQIKSIVRELFYPPPKADADGDVKMTDSAQNGENGSVEVISIMLPPEDDLSDIPPEIRETVIAEIAAFRERSHRRDLERLKQEEEFEAQERLRNGASRISRADSPGASNTNSIPVGPRGSLANAPSGPRAPAAGSRSVAFVNGANGDSGHDDDTDASDEELHRREVAKKQSEDDKLFLEAERRWVNRERSRAAALEREKERDESELGNERKNREMMAERLKNWDDDREASRRTELYYRDHSAWIRERTTFRAREITADDADRRAEATERAKAEAQQEQARGMADAFLERQAKEILASKPHQAPAPQPFKLSLGAAAQRNQAQRQLPQRKTMAEVEGLLEDEEEETTTRRQLVPIKFEPVAPGGAVGAGAGARDEPLSEEENQAAVKALAQEIPSDRERLWEWEVQWDYLDDSVIQEKLRPFVEKKIVDYLGVQEQLLVSVVEDHLTRHGKPGELVEELAEALDEAEELVIKLWRMVIFFSECERRGLTA